MISLQTMHQLFIVNAGSGFKFLWKALKAFLDTRTLAKIQVSIHLVISFSNRAAYSFYSNFEDYDFRCWEATTRVTWLKLSIRGTTSTQYFSYSITVNYIFLLKRREKQNPKVVELNNLTLLLKSQKCLGTPWFSLIFSFFHVILCYCFPQKKFHVKTIEDSILFRVLVIVHVRRTWLGGE